MAGVKGRSGRLGFYTKKIEMLINDTRAHSFYLIKRYLENEDIPLENRVRYAAVPFALKAIPDRQQVAVQHQLALSPELAARLVDIAQRNLDLQEELRALPAPAPPIEAQKPLNLVDSSPFPCEEPVR